MKITAYIALLAASLASAQVFNKHTEPFHLSLRSDNPALDGTSFVACPDDSNVFRQLCWWNAPASSLKAPTFRFEYNDADYRQQGYIAYNFTTVPLNDNPIVSEWTPMGFDIRPISNAVQAEFAGQVFRESLQVQYFRIDTEGRVVMQYVVPDTGEGRGLSNWFLCEEEIRSSSKTPRVLLYWGLGVSPDAEDMDAAKCVKVDVVRT